MIACFDRRSNRRKGQVVIFVAISIVALLGFVALSLDGGAIMSERRHAQATADAAALAAAGHLYYEYWVSSGNDPSGCTTAARAVAALNGYNNDLTTSKVEVYNPPITGPYTGRYGYVEVVVTYYHPRGFSSLFGSGSVEVTARSVAVGSPIAANVGVLVLDPTSKDALSIGSSISVAETPIVVNSTNAEGTIVSGSALAIAPEFDLTGGYTTTGGGALSGDINVSRPPMEDPFYYLPPPDPTTLTRQSNKKIQETQNSLVLQPGLYKGGIAVSGTGSIYMYPGIYYMQDGGFSFTGQGSLYAVGVLIYCSPGNGGDATTISGQGTITMSGMTSGIYQGMCIWQDRTSTVTASISGSSGTTNITGTFYFAGAQLNVTGNGGLVNVGSQYVSNRLAINGNGTVNLQWTPYTVARRRMITLVE